MHVVGDIIVFDDSKIHKAFNVPIDPSDGEPPLIDRIVLIVDIVRPADLPLGGATGKHTQELDQLISLFT
jgi:hypothetical protein